MTDIAELFARDPGQHTKESIDEIITYYRNARAQFVLGDTKAGKTTKPKGPAGPKLGSLDLDELLNKTQS
jgi:hypothetical protein